MQKSILQRSEVIVSFFLWRIWLFVIAFLAAVLIPKFGASFPYYDTALQTTKLPAWLWSFGNFDGVHYLRIAQNGYADAYYQAFFPLFPLLIRFFNIFPKNISLDTRVYVDPSYFYTGILLANVFLLFSLFVIKKIVKKKDFIWSAFLLLAFPTAFYFGSIYTESLFLLELVAFIWFLKKKNYLGAGIIASIASATRLVGILLSLVLLIEVVKDIYKKKIKLWSGNFYKSTVSLLVAPSGLLLYMFYLNKYFDNYLAFISVQGSFGADRSSLPIITLPQVFYRYLKMFVTVVNRTQLFNLSIEFVFALLGLIFLVWAFRKINLSWWLFAFLVYLLPTLTGTFSSMPRYLLFSYVVFIPIINKHLVRYRRWLVMAMAIIQIFFTTLFIRGYWIA